MDFEFGDREVYLIFIWRHYWRIGLGFVLSCVSFQNQFYWS